MKIIDPDGPTRCENCKEWCAAVCIKIDEKEIYLCNNCREDLICGLEASELGEFDETEA